MTSSMVLPTFTYESLMGWIERQRRNRWCPVCPYCSGLLSRVFSWVSPPHRINAVDLLRSQETERYPNDIITIACVMLPEDPFGSGETMGRMVYGRIMRRQESSSRSYSRAVADLLSELEGAGYTGVAHVRH